jgi:small GTP-binding protein
VFNVFEEEVDGIRVTLQIWDTAGQERYRSLGPLYYRKSNAAVAVFDLTRPETLAALDQWIRTFRDSADGSFVVVVGNKADLEADIRFKPEATSEWAEKRGAECIWASALSGIGVHEAFHAVARASIGGSEAEAAGDSGWNGRERCC